MGAKPTHGISRELRGSSWDSCDLIGTRLGFHGSLSYRVGTRGGSWELAGTRGGSWELAGTRGNNNARQ